MNARAFAIFVLGIDLVLLVISAGAAQEPERGPADIDSSRRSVPWDVELVGQVGGPVFAVAVQGNYAYLGVGPRLTVLDVSDPSRPAVVGQSKVLPEIVRDVFVAGPYAYVVGWHWGIRVLDISNPATPIEVGAYQTPGAAEAVYVAGHYAYVAAQTAGLRVIDVSDPAAPVEVGAYETGGRLAWDVHVAGHPSSGSGQRYAYLVDWAGLQIVDVSDPTHPAPVGILDTPGLAQGVYVAGQYAYVADEEAGLEIIDVSDPTTPTLVGTYDTPGRASNVHVIDNYAYVADVGSLQVVDVSNSTAPERVGVFDRPGFPSWVVNVDVADGHAYVVGGWDSSMRVVGISDPAAPRQTGEYGALGNAMRVYADDHPLPGSGQAPSTGSGQVYAYVVDEPFGLRVIDVSNPAVPRVAGAYEIPGITRDVYVADHYAYIANGQSGLWIVDLSDLDAITEVGVYTSAQFVSRVLVKGRYAYLTGGYSDTLRIVDVSDPATPVTAGIYEGQGAANGIFIADDYAYLAHEYRGLEILDVSDPSRPVKVGGYEMPGTTHAIDVADYYAYVANERRGLLIFDVSNPARPMEVGAYRPDEPTQFRDVYVARGPVADSGKVYAYVADAYNGLRVVDVSDPTEPVAAGFYPGSAVGVRVVGDYIFVAAQTGGLMVLRFTPGLTQWTFLPLVLR